MSSIQENIIEEETQQEIQKRLKQKVEALDGKCMGVQKYCNENENEKEKKIAVFDTDNLDTALYQDNCDWSFDKPINKPYHTIYIFDKEEE